MEKITTEANPLVDEEFVPPDVIIKEDVLWKTKTAVSEYAKFMHGIYDTLEKDAPNEAKMAGQRAEDLDELLKTLESLKPQQ